MFSTPGIHEFTINGTFFKNDNHWWKAGGFLGLRTEARKGGCGKTGKKKSGSGRQKWAEPDR
jgi:hypothetical protein